MNKLKLIGSVASILLITLIGLSAIHWTINRIYVPEGHSLQLTYKGPLLFGKRTEAPKERLAKRGEIGVQAEMMGPGRHFFCPLWWQRQVVPDQVVPPGHVGVVTSRLGRPLPVGEFLVNGDLDATEHNGTLRKVFTPGRYRVNPRAYSFEIVALHSEEVSGQVKHSGWVNIPVGYVGVVTYLADDPELGVETGIHNDVLPPGIYPANPKGVHIDIVEIGYRESSIMVEKQTENGVVVLDENGEPVPVEETGINFPSGDSYEIQLDFTAIWGVMPEHAAEIVRKFGSIEAIEEKVIIPQSESICRNNGSKVGAIDLLIGESRQKFQADLSAEFDQVLAEKGVSLLYGLVRHIYIPQSIRAPVQLSYVADELKLTRDQEKQTAKMEANLREAEKTVDLEAEKVRVETDKLTANVAAEGEKKAREIEAETTQLVAEIDLQVAELDAQKVVVLGQADAKAEEILAEATAEKFALAVQAFGTGGAYINWQFAEGLPDDIELKLLYAGEGTLWTDLENITPTVPLRQPKK